MTRAHEWGDSGQRNVAGGRPSRRNLLKMGALAAGAANIGTLVTAAAQPIRSSDLPSKSVRVGGFSQNVVDVGSGLAFLMLHGFPNSSTDWRHQIPALVNAGYRVIARTFSALGNRTSHLRRSITSPLRMRSGHLNCCQRWAFGARGSWGMIAAVERHGTSPRIIPTASNSSLP